MGHISRDCPNRDAMEVPSSRRVTFVDNKGKGSVNLEYREKAIANFEQYLCNEVDIIRANRMQEEVQTRSAKRMKEMARLRDRKKLTDAARFMVLQYQKIKVRI